jgi:phenylacetate-CoA ligase
MAFELFFHLGASREKILAFRDKHLKRLVRHAYRNVPYYRELFDKAGIKPEDIRTCADLKIVPLTSKKDIKERPVEQVVARGFELPQLIRLRTTGTSGMPLTIYRSRFDNFIHQAVRFRIHRHYGRKPKDHVACIVSSPEAKRLFVMRVVELMGKYRQSHIPLQWPVGAIKHVLLRLKPDVIVGNSAPIVEAARILQSSGLESLRPRMVVTGGEVLAPMMRKQLKDSFRCPVYDCYSSLETGLAAWQCPETGKYHINDDCIVLEVLPQDGFETTGEEGSGKEWGEAVVTVLHSYAMPFIRYRMEDLVLREPEPCKCRVPFSTLESIEGRRADYFYLCGGRLFYSVKIAHLIQSEASWVAQYEVIQETESRILIRIRPERPAGQSEIEGLKSKVAALVAEVPGVEIDISIAPEIKPGPGGKYRLLWSRFSPWH